MLKRTYLMTTLFLVLTAGLALAIEETFSRPQNAPVKSHYSLHFTVSENRNSPSSSATHEALVHLHIGRWDQNYDKTQYQVFLLLTTTKNSVENVYVNSSNKFVSGGWYNLNKMNRVLKTYHLAAVPFAVGARSWLYVAANAPLTAEITADTAAYSPSSSWRIVVIAEKNQSSSLSFIWSKVYRPLNN